MRKEIEFLKEKLNFYKNSNPTGNSYKTILTHNKEIYDLYPIKLCSSNQYILLAMIVNKKDTECPVIKVPVEVLKNKINLSCRKLDYYELVDYSYLQKKH